MARQYFYAGDQPSFPVTGGLNLNGSNILTSGVTIEAAFMQAFFRNEELVPGLLLIPFTPQTDLQNGNNWAAGELIITFPASETSKITRSAEGKILIRLDDGTFIHTFEVPNTLSEFIEVVVPRS